MRTIDIFMNVKYSCWSPYLRYSKKMKKIIMESRREIEMEKVIKKQEINKELDTYDR